MALSLNALVQEIAKRDYAIDTSFLKKCFGLSQQAAQKKRDYFVRHSFDHTNEHNDLIRMQFSKFLNLKYPPISARYDDDYFDELEKERESWY